MRTEDIYFIIFKLSVKNTGNPFIFGTFSHFQLIHFKFETFLMLKDLITLQAKLMT